MTLSIAANDAEEIETMKKVNLVFPHQLFEEGPLLKNEFEIFLIEEHLFFNQYLFHQQKIAFHRASMKGYEKYLLNRGKKVHYIESRHAFADMRNFSEAVKIFNIDEIHFIDPSDDYLDRRIKKLSEICQIQVYSNPAFLNTKEELSTFFKPEKKSFFQTTFYKQQRKKRNILLGENQQPIGGKWTYDTENRKKYPKNKIPPSIQFPSQCSIWEEAVTYTRTCFSKNPGNLSKERLYPINHEESKSWLDQFLNHRFFDFGVYEDAMIKGESFLNHSLLSPLLNSGLILPQEILDRALHFSEEENIPINSTEGFIRQIIGWREFIRGMYVCKGGYSRTRNFWGFDRKMPPCFYTGTTGIDPIDDTIQRVLDTGYCHHIERLMVLGNFMLLCEFDPDEVYRWFMELFIDAYDWVMVPNVYGMCLFADGGTFATKPYIGGANYIKKMSNYPSGEWEKYWNGLFWNFVIKHRAFFKSNPRTTMLTHSLDRMTEDKRHAHQTHAREFIERKLNLS